MDFGVGFLSNNVMLPILDFFYGVAHSYGLAIILLTLVIRAALFPLNAGSIRNMRKMKVVQPLMQKKMKEAQDKYADDPVKLREAQAELYQEFGNPLGGCLPLVFQMPVFIALFATLKGSPFADVPFDINLQIVPTEVAAEVQPAPISTAPKNIFLNEDTHQQVVLTSPLGSQLGVGSRTELQLQSAAGLPFADLADRYASPDADIALTPEWVVTKGEERVEVTEDGTVIALQPGDVTIEAKIPGLAANSGFLFIKELGRVGVRGDAGEIHWDILGMVLFFGVSTYLSQAIQGMGSGSQNPNQESVNKITPFIFSGMFLFIPLPAGVLIYMVISNVFQTVQTFFLSQEPLPENLQKLVDMERVEQEREERKASKVKGNASRSSLPFER